MKKNKLKKICIVLLFIIITCMDIYFNVENESKEENITDHEKISYEISNIPNYSGEIYTIINNNIPKFSEEDMDITEDYYSDLIDEKVRNGYGKDQLEKGK